MNRTAIILQYAALPACLLLITPSKAQTPTDARDASQPAGILLDDNAAEFTGEWTKSLKQTALA